MPVWHDATADRVARGELAVVGIASEQHRARTALWATSHEIDWPILWDPFNLTGSFAVPNAILVDASGTVVSTNVRPDGLEVLLDGLLDGLEPGSSTIELAPYRPHLAQLDRLAPDDAERPALAALSRCLWSGAAPSDDDLATLRDRASGDDRRADHVFQYGVAQRLHFDAHGARGGGFARAVAAWHDAFALTPRQYIWRRRIQQYGPRMDQPYDFYAWLPGAYRSLAVRPGWTFDGTLLLTPTELALAPSHDRVHVPKDVDLSTAWTDPDTQVSVVAVRGTTAETDTVCVHMIVTTTATDRRRLALSTDPLDHTTVGERVATRAPQLAGARDVLQFSVDLPHDLWTSGEPLPARLALFAEEADEQPRAIEDWIDLKALASP